MNLLCVLDVLPIEPQRHPKWWSDDSDIQILSAYCLLVVVVVLLAAAVDFANITILWKWQIDGSILAVLLPVKREGHFRAEKNPN